MYKNDAVSGGLDTGDNEYTNEIMFRRLPPVPMMVNTGPTETGKGYSCFQKKWSRTSKVSLLVVMALLCILLIVVGVLLSAAVVQAEKGKQSNTTIPVNELQFLRNKLDKLREITTPNPKDICPITWNRIGDSCYLFSFKQENWLNAVASCNKQQSKLLILTGKEEMESLRPLMNGKAFWIGLMKFLSIWMWLDGTTLTYSNWSPNEPNNNHGNEFCVEMKPEDWNDLNCDMKMNYICKK
ncbi:CD209 antigen-like protein E [Hyla sarda]|uniref:CD209 antigen-like protein E n=1 Tax=Hyla sarda TaxID=327740 RepID=UPI0024C3F187|nr:CD209 antigen-like protein E [Hyla sarda]